MKKNRIAAQMYSFRDFISTPEAFADTVSKLKKMGYDAIQLSGSIAPMPEKELRRILDGEGIVAPTAHESAAKIIDDTDSVIEHLLNLECLHVAYPYPHQLPKNADETKKLAGQLEQAAKKMEKSGITLAYHNHSIEFLRFGKQTMLDIIYSNTSTLEAELDTFWVHAGGGNAVDWIKRLAPRMSVLHIKDFGITDPHNRVMMPIGGGNLDWPGIVSAAEDGGVEWFVVEHDGDCPDPFASFKTSMDFLCENFVK
ncbi:MAG: sugar phosphate isomerase/epimerase [Victivallales bacterium]|nr:sugar phosphate isomerase/epimerase [Victivallales bacterium]